MKKETSFKRQEWSSDIGNNENDWNNFVRDFYKEEWDKLDNNEKAICMNYEKQLKRKEEPSLKLIKVINEIHEKYPDFHMGCLPKEKNIVKTTMAMTQDFSGYLPEPA
jgi:hypothetical protein